MTYKYKNWICALSKLDSNSRFKNPDSGPNFKNQSLYKTIDPEYKKIRIRI